MSDKRKVSTTTDGKPGFRPVEDSRDILKYVTYASDSSAKADFRIGASTVKIPARVDDRTSIKTGVILNLEKPLDDQQKQQLESADEFMVVVYIQGQMLLGVRAKKVQLEENQILMKEDLRFFIMQRRSEARFEIPRGYDFELLMHSVEGPKRIVAKRLLDISTSGMGFLAMSSHEAQLYSVGMVLEGVHLPLQGRTMDVDLEVKSHAPLKNHPHLSGVKVGCKIVAISPEDEEHLLAFVAAKLLGL